MARMRIKIDGFQEILKTIDNVGGNTQEAISNALIKSQEVVTSNINKEMTRYKVNTGEMQSSIIDDKRVIWYGGKASIFAGFDQNNSMHATYMMITGTPYRKPDKKLYNAIYGAKTKKEIRDIQIETLQNAIEEAMR